MAKIDESFAVQAAAHRDAYRVGYAREGEPTSPATCLEAMIGEAGHTLAKREIVTDDISAIRAKVESWIADPGIDVVITTGGTGFTGRDVTPDAVKPLFEKEIEGFSVVFHMLSFQSVATSTIQSRACGGTANGTYVFCLPGSPGPARTRGTASSSGSSTAATGPAISSISCRA